MLSSKWVYISKNKPIFTPSPPPPPSHLPLIRSWAVQYCFLQQEILSCLQVACHRIAAQHCLRWLDTVFKGQYLPRLSIDYVAINKDLEKLLPTTTSFICMTIQAHTVLQKLCLGVKITTQGNYVTLITIFHEHQNKLKYIL